MDLIISHHAISAVAPHARGGIHVDIAMIAMRHTKDAVTLHLRDTADRDLAVIALPAARARGLAAMLDILSGQPPMLAGYEYDQYLPDAGGAL